MKRSSICLGIAALAVVSLIHACGENSGSPTGPETTRATLRAQQSACGEPIYLSMLSPVLSVWEDSIETWLGNTALLGETPVWMEESTVGGYLAALAPVLQQWEGAINDSLAIATLDTVADFDPATTPRQEYLAELSSLLVSWKTAMETERGRAFLPAPPTFQPDTSAPVLTCPSDTAFACADTNGVVVDYLVSAIDDCDPAPVVVCDPPAGSTFPVGSTLVTCTATDSSGNQSTCEFTVTVDADTEPPVIIGARATPGLLWPPNHKWVDVQITVDAEDACDPAPVCFIVDVTSNEPVNGLGDGDTEPDWLIGDVGLKLRAERSGTGSGRIYSVLVRCEDASGNSTDTTVEVRVPHDRGK